MNMHTSPHINTQKKTIEFFLPKDYASHVSVKGADHVVLSGSFNNWALDVLLMQPDEDMGWKIEIPMLPRGKYQYKFLVDDKMWMEDIENPNREPDGLYGFNSILTV